jgi:hypothetical protein
LKSQGKTITTALDSLFSLNLLSLSPSLPLFLSLFRDDEDGDDDSMDPHATLGAAGMKKKKKKKRANIHPRHQFSC